MSNLKKFIRDFYNLENDIFFNQLHDTGESIYTFNQNIDYEIWNHAFPYNIDTKKDEKMAFSEFVRDTVSFFVSKGRKPVVYLDDKYFGGELHKVLVKNNFEIFDDEAWMEFKELNDSGIPDIEFDMISVDCLRKFRSFSKVVDCCFSEKYSKELKEDFNKNFGFKKIEHFIFRKNKTLIGCASIYYDKNTAHIHNIGVLPCFRGNGYGKVVIKQVFNYIKNTLNLPIILQCEGVSVESFYKKLGAKTFYRRYGYMLKY